MQVVGSDELGRAIVSRPSGLEKLDAGEILRLRYLGMLSGSPEGHFLGTDPERSFRENGYGLRKRWERVRHQFYGGEKKETLWREAYHEIGRMCAWLDLPSYVREEIMHIYASLRAQEETGGKHRTLEEVLAKTAYLACLIHRLPRNHEDIEHRIRELYGLGIGAIPSEFVKAANTRLVKFRTKTEKDGHEYLRRYELQNGQMFNEKVLARL